MKFVRKHIAVLTALAAVVFIAAAEGLPSLPKSDDITTGKLANGITYYLSIDKENKGEASIALVQRVGHADESPSTAGHTSVMAMGAFCDLPHFKTPDPVDFLGRNGIMPGSDGYVKVNDNSTIIRFDNIEMERGQELVDSVLLMVFDIIGKETNAMHRYYAPANQAIVVSGDIDATAVLNKMKLLSMMVPDKGLRAPDKRVSRELSSPGRNLVFGDSDNYAVKISAIYSTPRTPDEMMSTVQPLVAFKLTHEMGTVIKRRLEEELRSAEIPFSDLVFDFSDSRQSSGRESTRIDIVTSKKYVVDAYKTLAHVLGNLSTEGIDPTEYSDIEKETNIVLRELLGFGQSGNKESLERCIASFLYGSSLASVKSEYEFLTKKVINPGTSAKLLNSYMQAVLDMRVNLTLECSLPQTEELKGSINAAFDKGWKAGASSQKGRKPHAYNSDTLLIVKNPEKVKIRAEYPEMVGNGTLFLLDNGIRVAFKKGTVKDMVYFDWSIRGGYPLVKGITSKDRDHIADMVWLASFDGMDGYDFFNVLQANGISIKASSFPSALTLSGEAPSSSFDLLIKSLVAVTARREASSDAFAWWRKCHVTNDNSSERTVSKQLQKKAEEYFESEFSRMNDGVLTIIGDISEDRIRKVMTAVGGSFKTGIDTPVKPISSPILTTERYYEVTEGQSSSLELSLACRERFSSESFATAWMSGLAVRNTVHKAASECGWIIEYEDGFSIFPDERYFINISLKPAEEGSLPASMIQKEDVNDVINCIEKALKRLAGNGLEKSEVDTYRKIVSNRMANSCKTSEFIRQMMRLRYVYGRNLIGRFDEKVAAVPFDRVDSLARILAGGGISGKATRFIRPYILSEDLTPEIILPTLERVVPTDSLGLCRAFRQAFLGEKMDSLDFKLELDITKWAPDTTVVVEVLPGNDTPPDDVVPGE